MNVAYGPRAPGEDRERDLRDVNEALLVSSVRQHELAEEAQKAAAALRESREQLEQQLADTELLRRLSTELVEQDTVDVLYEKILDAAVAIMHSDFASIQAFHPERGAGGELLLVNFRGFSPEAVKFWEWVRADSGSVCAMALRTAQRSVVPDVEKCDLMAGTADLAVSLQSGIHAVQTTPLLSRTGRLVGMISTHWKKPHSPSERDLRLIDIVARQAADLIERGQNQKKMLEQTEALADLHRRKDEFLAMLSHELRNPLASIANAAQILRLQKDADPIRESARAIIERQTGQLSHIVDDLLEVSRISTGRIHLRQERVALGSIVKRAVETVRPLTEQRRHVLKLTMQREPIYIYADAARLEQVVVNLLNNAAKYTDVGGTILVTAVQEGDEAVLRVRDSGEGIAPELLPHIFELFTQAARSLDRSQGGLGIGLCLVQRLVEMHGGQVEVSSSLGQGSEFVVRLPVMADALPPEPPVEKTVAVTGASLRVLVVDDNADAADSLATLLKVAGHDVRTVYDGPSVVDAVLDYRPHAILLDLGLPGLDGYEIAKRLRAQPELGNVLLVAMTGYGHESDRLRSQEAGFDQHLVKPADFNELRTILETVCPADDPTPS